MEFVNKLFKYIYYYNNQGTDERCIEYALLNVPKDATFENNRSTLYKTRNNELYHNIDINTIKDLTIQF